MKKIAVIMLAAAGLWVSASAQSDLFSTIQNWTGTGANEAAFEIDWNNGTDLVWGYRWNGTATGEQMLDAIVAADPRLYAEVSEPTAYGTALFGLGYHASGDQNFSLNPILSFDNQHLAYTDYDGANDLRTAVNAGDQWQEGWNPTSDATAGYWAYFNSTDSRLTADPTDWDYAATGMTGRTLDDGDVDGWVYSYYNIAGNDSVPGNPLAATPTPEPSTCALLGLSSFIFLCYQRNLCSKKKLPSSQA